MKRFSQITCLLIGWGMSSADAAEILWSQYCQHEDKMKLLAHLDTDPSAGTRDAGRSRTESAARGAASDQTGRCAGNRPGSQRLDVSR